jgi:hypothetical protein
VYSLGVLVLAFVAGRAVIGSTVVAETDGLLGLRSALLSLEYLSVASSKVIEDGVARTLRPDRSLGRADHPSQPRQAIQPCLENDLKMDRVGTCTCSAAHCCCFLRRSSPAGALYALIGTWDTRSVPVLCVRIMAASCTRSLFGPPACDPGLSDAGGVRRGPLRGTDRRAACACR